MNFAFRTTDQDKEVVKLNRYNGAIPVCYCFDRSYANFTAVSSFSLHKNSLIPPKIYWIVPARDFDYCLQLLDTVNKFGMDITICKLNAPHFSGWKGHDIAYYRLLLPALLEYDKVLYIDSDTLVLAGLEELFNIDISNNLVAGVVDPGGYTSQIFHHLEENDPYLNGGLLLMNLKLMREMNFVEACKRIYHQYQSEINYGDQDVLNLVARGLKKNIDNKFCVSQQVNDQTYQNIENAIKHSYIIHFVGGIKPWMRCANKKAFSFWWDYANKLNIPDLAPIEITNITQVLFLAQCHDINEEYVDASRWKSKAIQLLMNK
jgi:lipopolysaccharide biosynthesis glycosyltransferase